jgi:hypothetical protein
MEYAVGFILVHSTGRPIKFGLIYYLRIYVLVHLERKRSEVEISKKSKIFTRFLWENEEFEECYMS